MFLIFFILVMVCCNLWERGMIFWELFGEFLMSEERIDLICLKLLMWEMLMFDRKLWKLDWFLWF